MKDDLPPWSEAAKNVKPGIYRHFKGGEIRVVGIAHHTETFEEMVVYHHTDGKQGLWVRPLVMWLEHVDRDGYSGPRFRFIREQ